MGLYVHRISSIALHGGDIPALTVLLVQDALVIIKDILDVIYASI